MLVPCMFNFSHWMRYNGHTDNVNSLVNSINDYILLNELINSDNRHAYLIYEEHIFVLIYFDDA